MSDFVNDKKFTQDQADDLQAPMELDLIALFKVLESDMLETSEDYRGSPDAFINDLLTLISEPGGEVNKSLKNPTKKDLYDTAGKMLRMINKRCGKNNGK